MSIAAIWTLLRGLSPKTMMIIGGVVAVAVIVVFARMDAVSDMKAKQAKEDAEQLRRMIDAGNEVDTTPDGIGKRLRDGEF